MSRSVLAPLASLLLWLSPLAPCHAAPRLLVDPSWEGTPLGTDAPRLTLLATLAMDEAPPATIEPEIPAQRPLGRRPVNAPPQMTLDAPVPAGAWAAYGGFALMPLGGIYGASRMGGAPLWVTTAQTVAGSAVGSLPGALLFLQPPAAGGRWAEADVMAFGVGMVLTPPLTALGTWGVGELAGAGGPDRGRTFLGALGGAAVGALLGVALHGVMEEVVGNRDALKSLRKTIALGFIGSGSTAGYQWAARTSRASRP